ncbi:MAG: DUF1573 domain-containing protein [Saprospiraceae bacterium]
MKNLILFFAFILSIGMVACANDEEGVQETAGGKNSEIIRNPISADHPLDSNQLARITFEQNEYDFGTVPEGQVVEHFFKFTNTGKVPLLISNARSTCGCTVPEWPKEEIGPGESGELKATFNSDNRAGSVRKPIIVSANTYPNEVRVLLKGTVTPKRKKQ